MAAPGIVGIASGSRTFVGAITVPPPASATSWLALVICSTDEGLAITVPIGWTRIALTGGYEHAAALYMAHTLPGETWTIVSAWSASIIVVGYDAPITVQAIDQTVDTDVPQTSPSITATDSALVMRWLSGNSYPNAPTVAYPSNATLWRHQEISPGVDYAVAAIAHSTQPSAGPTGTADWECQELASNGDGLAGTVLVWTEGGGGGPVTHDIDGMVVAALAGSIGTVSLSATLSGSTPALSGATGVAGADFEAAGQVDTQSMLTGAVASTQAISGQVVALSSITGSVDAFEPGGLDGQVAATSDTSGTAGLVASVSGQVPAVSTATGGVEGLLHVAGVTVVESAVAGDAIVVPADSMAGSVAAASGSSGVVQLEASIGGSAAVVSTVTGSTSADMLVSATTSATSSATGDLSSIQLMSGVIVCATLISGTVTVRTPESGWQYLTLCVREPSERIVASEPPTRLEVGQLCVRLTVAERSHQCA